MAIVFQHDKRSGITYAYESKSYYDKEKKCSRAKRTLIGRVNPETGDIIPTDGRNRLAKEAKPASAPEVNKDEMIRELFEENRQLKLQVASLTRELARLKSSGKR